MNLEVVNIAATSFAAVKMLLLLLFSPEDFLKNAQTSKEVDEYLKNNSYPLNNEEIRAMVSWTKDDNFTEETLKNNRNVINLKKLSKLKRDFLDFYLQYLSDLSVKSPEYQRNCDVNIRIGKYIIQIMRLRILIQPDIQIALNKHTQTNHEYLAAKAFWINDDGVKIRKFTRSLGRLEEYENGKDDPKARIEGTIKIQEKIQEAYLTAYPE